MTTTNELVITAEPGQHSIGITREFDAPRELVFEAFTDPELLVQWMGPRELTMEVDVFEPRTGGSYRYVQKDEKGNEYAFHGVYHEVLGPERIIQTFEFEGLPEKGHAALEVAHLEELPGGRTRLRIVSVYLSVADRDGHIHSGMERGVRDSYDRLAELLEKRK